MTALPAHGATNLPVRIGVKLVTDATALTAGPGVAILRPAQPHRHADGATCPACLAGSDIRTQLWNLLEEARTGRRPRFSMVLVDASGHADPSALAEALVPGRLPARSLAHHAVARTFVLVD